MDDLPDKQQLANNYQPFDLAQGKPAVKTGGHPEKEPAGDSYLEEVEITPELGPEVQKAGVETVRREIELTAPDKKAGLIEAGEAAPVSVQPTGLVNLPLTDDQIEKALHQKLTDSILWLATWCVRQLKLIHYRLRGGE